MDEYQCCTLEDAQIITDKLSNNESVIFGYKSSEITNLAVYIGPPIAVLGLLPYGGQPHGRYLIGIVYKGFFHFDFSKTIFPSYVGEKLNLPEQDAVGLTELLNEIIRCMISK